jgi:predicted esterase
MNAWLATAVLMVVGASGSTAELPPSPPIEQATLQQMYREELGEAYQPQMGQKLYEAHHLLERYFQESSSAQRQRVVKDLENLRLSPGWIGRLARLRMNWPDLKGGVYYTNQRIGPHQVMYFLGIPKDYSRTRPWPLVVKLPTAAAFVTNPPPEGPQVVELYSRWIKEELAAHPDAVVLMPRLNLDELYGPSQAGMNTVIQPLLHAAGQANIDPARVYLQGHSMSAHAVWNLGLHYTTYWTAITPLAGGAHADWQRLRLMNLRNTPVIAWHDADDKLVPVEEARQLVQILKRLACPVEYQETKGLGHSPTEQIVAALYDKMCAAGPRPLYPPAVSLQSNRPETMFNRLDWVQVYQPVSTGAEKRYRFTRGSGLMTVYQHTFSLSAARAARNRFELKTDNVDTLRLYFNDQMVDFARPVTVLVNGKGKFEGLLEQSIDEMLRDQAFLGRGWRYYTAILDLELAARAPTTAGTRPATTRKGVIEVIPSDPDQPIKRIEVP